jgi:hypothetical protein
MQQQQQEAPGAYSSPQLVRMSTDGQPSPHPSSQQQQQQQQQQGGGLPCAAPGASVSSAGPFAATGWGVPSPPAAAAASAGGGGGPGAVRFDSITSPDTAAAAAAAAAAAVAAVAAAAGQSPQQLVWPHQQQQQQQQGLAIGVGPECLLLPHSISTGSMQLLDSPAAAAAAAAAGGPGGFASGPVSDGVLLAALRRQLQAEGGLSGELPLSLAPTLSLTSQM